jgi:nucleoside-diphosphate-sugar epimerase
VQHEREPLGGAQRLEDHEQGETDRVGQQRLVLGVGAVRPVHDRFRNVHARRLLAPRVASPQHVQRHASDHRRQPCAEVVDVAGIRATEPQPRAVRTAILETERDAIIHQATALADLRDFKHFDRSFAPTDRLRTEGTDALLAAAREAGVRRFVAQSFASARTSAWAGRSRPRTIHSTPPRCRRCA